jgi:hypothetical protein
MSSKKKNPATNLQALRIGSRVRFRDDGVEGRITWANAVSVKIQWDDGEAVTWRRDALATKPIDILGADAAGEDVADEASLTASEQVTSVELPQRDSAIPTATADQATPTEVLVAQPAPAQEQTATTTALPAAEAPAQEPQAAPGDNATEPPAAAKPKWPRKAPAEPKGKKVSALDAAARVLAEENRPMSCQELIDVMAARGYWASPKGATPAATLYSAVLRELTTKGSAARFVKTERGKFARNPGA